ncbi:MAG: 6-pyruvoyl trahydropterin synthase family protein [Mucilaginibacter sp.]
MDCDRAVMTAAICRKFHFNAAHRVMDLKPLKNMVEEYITKPFDHRNLNLDVPEFAGLNRTAENIAVVIYQLLKPLITQKLTIILYETERNFVEYDGA